MALSRLVTLSISSLRYSNIEAKNSVIELINFMMLHFLPGITLNIFLGHV